MYVHIVIYAAVLGLKSSPVPLVVDDLYTYVHVHIQQCILNYPNKKFLGLVRASCNTLNIYTLFPPFDIHHSYILLPLSLIYSPYTCNPTQSVRVILDSIQTPYTTYTSQVHVA